MKREYFYTERGKIKPYHYCSDCGKQYRDDEMESGLIVNMGSNITPIKYCAKPCLLIKFPSPVLKKPESERVFIEPEAQEVVEECF
jgi:hypothetical protein